MRSIAYIALAALSFFSASARAENQRDVYGISFRTIDGNPLPLSEFKGKVVLVVNVASQCGFTPQYGALEKVYEAYKDKGLVVLGVPSNDFGNQEPGTEAQICHFAQSKYHVTFPLASKEVVSGKEAHPFYLQVRQQLGLLASPRWNFYKYVISRDGHLVAWFSSMTTPDSAVVKKAIEAELAK